MSNLIRLTGMWENKSKTGETYFTGALGGVKLLLLKDRYAGEGDPGWRLMVTARPEKKPDRVTGTDRRVTVGARRDGVVGDRAQQQPLDHAEVPFRDDVPFDDELPPDMRS